MKEILKDYGALIGPIFAFTLGVIAIYIKFYTDRQTESWKSRKKKRKLIQLILDSKPPSKYYPQKSDLGMIHADQARNSTNLSIFYKKLEVINAYITTVENDILTNCSVKDIQQFHDLKFIMSYLTRDVETYRSMRTDKNNLVKLPEYNDSDFRNLTESYERLITVCNNPASEFHYIER
jgi:hypothetical protein